MATHSAFGDYKIGDVTHMGVVPCNLWRCMYCQIPSVKFGVCLIQRDYRIRPNKKSCKQRQVIDSRLIKRVRRQWEKGQ